MALFKFTKAILAGEKIPVFNYGKHRRDFTYVDDIVEGVIRVLDRPARPDSTWSGAKPDAGTSMAPWRVYNIGNNSPVELMDYIAALEKALGKKRIWRCCRYSRVMYRIPMPMYLILSNNSITNPEHPSNRE